VIDNFSRWPEVVLVKKADAQHIITAMEGIFIVFKVSELIMGHPLHRKSLKVSSNILALNTRKVSHTGPKATEKLRDATRQS
jgi:hypothetical protein